MSIAVILANGTPPRRETLEAALAGAALFVCADGGVNTAAQYALRAPDAIVGDLDSADPAALRHFPTVQQIRNTDTETYDAEKAVAWVLAQGGAFDEIRIFGATAGRLDHVLGSLSLLHRYRDHARIVLEDDAIRAWLDEGTVTIDEPVGTVVSFFAIGEPAENVTTENLEYPLRDCRIELGAQDSLSNIVVARPARVTIGHGNLVFIVVKQP
jgi:thiamine pyrophosphokinase